MEMEILWENRPSAASSPDCRLWLYIALHIVSLNKYSLHSEHRRSTVTWLLVLYVCSAEAVGGEAQAVRRRESSKWVTHKDL